MGDFESGMLASYHKGELEILTRIPLPNSIGRVYSSITNFIGFRANNDEEKVMALGAYGRDAFARQFKSLIKVTPTGFETNNLVFWNRDCGMGYTNESQLPAYFGRKRKQSRSFPSARYRDIARSLQEQLFRVSDALLTDGLNKTGYKQLCMSGGIALNCENNGRLAIAHSLVDVHVQPQAGDSGIALGAAYACHFTETGRRPEAMKHVYYGSAFEEEEMRATLATAKVEYRKTSDLEGEISESLARGQIVGWFQGASEVGPRALGNRSILASASLAGMDKRVNGIKGRELWRPLAPSILDERAASYFDYYAYAPFMTLALPLSDLGRRSLKAAKHVNETTRPQTLRRETNPRYYEVIAKFAKLTGTPAILNTSFNVANEPIVDTPKQALADFMTTALDVLVLGNYVITKRAAS
jgi:carbamoyltransferase